MATTTGQTKAGPLRSIVTGGAANIGRAITEALLAGGGRVAIGQRSPDARFFKQPRFQWGLFTGTKGSDLKPANEYQPMG